MYMNDYTHIIIIILNINRHMISSVQSVALKYYTWINILDADGNITGKVKQGL